jgi:hypothetical protein
LADALEFRLEVNVVARGWVMFGSQSIVVDDGFLTAALVLRDVLIAVVIGFAFHKATLRWDTINPRLTLPALST